MFKFEVQQRVMVPGTNGAQGVITDRVESLPGFPVYNLNWVMPDGSTSCCSCGESELAEVNPTDADILAEAAVRSDRERALEAEVEFHVKQRLAGIAKLRRKRKSTPKRKR